MNEVKVCEEDGLQIWFVSATILRGGKLDLIGRFVHGCKDLPVGPHVMRFDIRI